jgi:hypothetical protein
MMSAPAPIRKASLAVNGCRLFNLLPASIHNMKATSVDQFKLALENSAMYVTSPPERDLEG